MGARSQTWAPANLLRRSTARLERDLAAAVRADCECDAYHGFTCGKHRRVEDVSEALRWRREKTPHPWCQPLSPDPVNPHAKKA